METRNQPEILECSLLVVVGAQRSGRRCFFAPELAASLALNPRDSHGPAPLNLLPDGSNISY